MPRYRLQVFADYHQFYLHDGDFDISDLDELWTKEALKKSWRLRQA
jgi:hypothetical protein